MDTVQRVCGCVYVCWVPAVCASFEHARARTSRQLQGGLLSPGMCEARKLTNVVESGMKISVQKRSFMMKSYYTTNAGLFWLLQHFLCVCVWEWRRMRRDYPSTVQQIVQRSCFARVGVFLIHQRRNKLSFTRSHTVSENVHSPGRKFFVSTKTRAHTNSTWPNRWKLGKLNPRLIFPWPGAKNYGNFRKV